MDLAGFESAARGVDADRQEAQPVAPTAAAFHFSRPSFYHAQRAFQQRGLTGLLLDQQFGLLQKAPVYLCAIAGFVLVLLFVIAAICAFAGSRTDSIRSSASEMIVDDIDTEAATDLGATALHDHVAILRDRGISWTRIGQALDLFTLSPIAPGSPFFHPKGAVVYNTLVQPIANAVIAANFSGIDL